MSERSLNPPPSISTPDHMPPSTGFSREHLLVSGRLLLPCFPAHYLSFRFQVLYGFPRKCFGGLIEEPILGVMSIRKYLLIDKMGE